MPVIQHSGRQADSRAMTQWTTALKAADLGKKSCCDFHKPELLKLLFLHNIEGQFLFTFITKPEGESYLLQ